MSDWREEDDNRGRGRSYKDIGRENVEKARKALHGEVDATLDEGYDADEVEQEDED